MIENFSIIILFFVPLLSDDLLRVVIDIYKLAGNRLPLCGEVEICNHDTSLEKV